ncbi:hypothetical protein JVT61DRAFT_10841 [Boletus reticuloceps]|uniref:Uncharacterized protein n=1 Tax=Boletus reticuloceps TaxID=495285 RepID=A0A8I2YFF8_9AGAM|nr:hypothetical protein JVT61DRAFT_10841 [Boletus reticuloceps]
MTTWPPNTRQQLASSPLVYLASRIPILNPYAHSTFNVNVQPPSTKNYPHPSTTTRR